LFWGLVFRLYRELAGWQAERDKPHSQAEQAAFMHHTEEARKHAEVKRQQQLADAAAKAAMIWNAGTGTPAYNDHLYLVREGSKPTGPIVSRFAGYSGAVGR